MFRRTLPLLAVAFVMAFAVPIAAHAAGTAVFSAPMPAAGATVKTKPTSVWVTADDTAPILSATVTLNGVPVTSVTVEHSGHTGFDEEQEAYYWVVDDYTKARVTGYFASSRVLTGVNTVVTTVISANGASTNTSTFVYGTGTPPPAIALVAPAAGAVLPDSPAVVSATLSSSQSSFAATMVVDGTAVPTVYTLGTKTYAYSPGAGLIPGVHTVAFTARDIQGATVSTTWSFKVQPPMSTSWDCGSCHATTLQTHTVSGCADCHDRAYAPAGRHGGEIPSAAGCVGDGGGQQDDACHRMDHTSDSQWGIWGAGPFACADCHSVTHPAVPQHTDAEVDAAHVSTTTGCSNCHDTSLIAEHAKYPSATTLKYQCDLCHGSSARQQVKDAITAGTTACGACHPSAHDDLGPQHQATITGYDVTISGQDFGVHACSECHAEDNLLPVHVTTDADCAKCHPTPKSTLTPSWDKSCAQGGCHTGSTATMHSTIDTDHVVPEARADCLASGCHDANAITPFAGRSVALIHAEASTTTAGGETRASCSVCHFTGATLTTDCATAGCHADRLEAHGYDPAKHLTTGTCVLTCHGPLQGLDELKPVHDAITTPITCSGCHPTKVASITPWDKTCTACHPVSDLHPAAAQSHVGTDVAYRDASFLGNGCTPDAGHTEMLSCHDIGSVVTLHSRMSCNGCAVCHGTGKTPAPECLDCHSPGSATAYTRPGTASANIISTGYPSSDSAITPGWTYTTTPVSQPVYAVVNTPYPPATTTRYVTIASTSTGGVLFGFDALSIPTGARIVDVRIYAKAKATNSTYPRKMQGVFKIGGQSYLSSNLSNNLTTSWTAGAGTGFATPSTRVDFTREPLYGESIWRNPRTGLDWTAEQLNGTDPVNSLEAFGINLTSSTGANSVSLSQIYLKVTYYTVGPSATYPTVGTGTYHHNNAKYLHNAADAAGKRFGVSPVGGWNDALYNQDCYDFCHRGNGGQPTFSAPQGEWMWYSVGGDPYDPVIATRTLALKSITLPTVSPTLSFTTNYQLGTGAAGYVEISTDGGSVWTPLTGTVGGSSRSSLTGNAAGWVPATYDLSAYAGQSAKLRFRYVNGSSASAGWAFDSLTVAGGSGVAFSDDAETLKTDWTNTYWTRSMGAFPYQ